MPRHDSQLPMFVMGNLFFRPLASDVENPLISQAVKNEAQHYRAVLIGTIRSAMQETTGSSTPRLNLLTEAQS
jgi:hypothetical protein